MENYAQKFLESLHRFDLALLTSVCACAIEEVDRGWGDFFGNRTEEVVTLRAPPPVDAALRVLPPADKKRIAEAVASGVTTRSAHEDIRIETLGGPVTGAISLLGELICQREAMISVATGGDRIQDVNDYYIAREARIREGLPAGVSYENPHADLWQWYRHWKDNFGTYSDRRQYVRNLFSPAILAITKRPSLSTIERELTGWERVDRGFTKARGQLEKSSAEEDFQGVGLLCREVIISLAQAVYDPALHGSLDGVTPSLTDANRMLEAYVHHVFPGESYKEVRAHARASLALALNLQHRRTATRQLAALCVEATGSTTAVISIIARSKN
jgi:hypothetical protein